MLITKLLCATSRRFRIQNRLRLRFWQLLSVYALVCHKFTQCRVKIIIHTGETYHIRIRTAREKSYSCDRPTGLVLCQFPTPCTQIWTKHRRQRKTGQISYVMKRVRKNVVQGIETMLYKRRNRYKEQWSACGLPYRAKTRRREQAMLSYRERSNALVKIDPHCHALMLRTDQTVTGVSRERSMAKIEPEAN